VLAGPAANIGRRQQRREVLPFGVREIRRVPFATHRLCILASHCGTASYRSLKQRVAQGNRAAYQQATNLQQTGPATLQDHSADGWGDEDGQIPGRTVDSLEDAAQLRRHLCSLSHQRGWLKSVGLQRLVRRSPSYSQRRTARLYGRYSEGNRASR
jgi:hypothetical protein